MSEPEHEFFYDPGEMALVCPCGYWVPACGPDSWRWIETRMRSHLQWPDGTGQLPPVAQVAQEATRPELNKRTILTRLHDAQRTLRLYADQDRRIAATDRKAETVAAVLAEVLAHVGVSYESGRHDPLWARAFAALRESSPIPTAAGDRERAEGKLRSRVSRLEHANGALMNENDRLAALAYHPATAGGMCRGCGSVFEVGVLVATMPDGSEAHCNCATFNHPAFAERQARRVEEKRPRSARRRRVTAQGELELISQDP